MFVGLTELFLEFIKPVTLSMRLFGNIFGGEVALGVVTGLFVAFIPVALYGLEIMLTFVQALIFSTLTLMFILVAIEGHHYEEEHTATEGIDHPERVRSGAPANAH
jgi:F-type H+-transporting ATPase subunit a